MEIAKFFGHNFDDNNFELFDKNDNQIYYEDFDGYWSKSEYNENNFLIYYENSYGYWSKSEYNKDRKEIYFEDSDGTIRDIRPKTIDKEIIIDGKKYQLVENKT